MTNTIPSVSSVATDVANGAGSALIGAITTSLPLVFPVLAVLFAVRFVLSKIGFGR